MGIIKKMKNKKLIIRLIAIFIAVVLMIMGANADNKGSAEKLGEIHVKATVVKGFTSEFELTCFDEKGYSIVFNLNKSNNYTNTLKAPVGNYNVSNIAISKGYKARVANKFRVIANKTTNINAGVEKIVVEKAITTTNKVKSTGNNTKKATDRKIKTDDLINKDSKNNMNQDKTKEKESTENNNHKSLKIGNSGIFTLIILAGLIIAAVYAKFRNNRV